MVFSAEAYFNYLDKIRSAGIKIPLIPGIRPVTCQKHVHAAEEVFKANVPASLKKSLKGKSESQARKICLDFTVKLCGALKDGGAPGVHMFVLNDVEMAGEIIGEIRS
jgi:methylenetetrahydrofolate reductase (NADPH)